jgi:hypothetical protein
MISPNLGELLLTFASGIYVERPGKPKCVSPLTHEEIFCRGCRGTRRKEGEAQSDRNAVRSSSMDMACGLLRPNTLTGLLTLVGMMICGQQGAKGHRGLI